MKAWLVLMSTLSLLFYSLISCSSPRQTSTALTEEILHQLPRPAEAQLMNQLEFENLSKTGIGTCFGVVGFYGSDEDYVGLVETYTGLWAEQGWLVNDFGGYKRFCNPDFADVEISLEQVESLEGQYGAMLEDTNPDDWNKYVSLYAIRVSHFPFDSPTCVDGDS